MLRPSHLAVSLAFVAATVLSGCSDQPESDRSAEAPTTASKEPQATTDSPTDTKASGTKATDTKASDADPPTPGDEAGAEVPETLRFEATALDGSTFDASRLAGKPTVFWFWAPWCAVCRAQIPDVEALAAQYGGDVNVVGVGGLDSESAIEDFASDLDGLTLLVDDEGTVWQRFGVTEQSSFVILDADGNEVTTSGYGEDIDLSAEVADLLS
jgi:thiol-disulfide isomerase/thioredoxin